MTGLQLALQRVCSELGLEVSHEKTVELGQGQSVVALSHIRNLGAINGMLIFTQTGIFWPQKTQFRKPVMDLAS